MYVRRDANSRPAAATLSTSAFTGQNTRTVRTVVKDGVVFEPLPLLERAVAGV